MLLIVYKPISEIKVAPGGFEPPSTDVFDEIAKLIEICDFNHQNPL